MLQINEREIADILQSDGFKKNYQYFNFVMNLNKA